MLSIGRAEVQDHKLYAAALKLTHQAQPKPWPAQSLLQLLLHGLLITQLQDSQRLAREVQDLQPEPRKLLERLISEAARGPDAATRPEGLDRKAMLLKPGRTNIQGLKMVEVIASQNHTVSYAAAMRCSS